MSSLQIVAFKSLIPMGTKVAGTLVTFILSVTIARTLGVYEFGIYSLIVSTIMVLSIPIGSGIPLLVTRETSKAVANLSRSTVDYLLIWSNCLIVPYSVMTTILVIAIYKFSTKSDFLFGLAISMPVVYTFSITLRNSAVLRSFQKFEKGILPDVLIRPFLHLVTFVILYWSVLNTGVTAVFGLLAFIFASSVACLVSAVWVRNELKGLESGQTVSPSLRHSLKRSLFLLTIAGGGHVLFGNMDTLMLGLLGEPEQVGAYRVSVQLSMLIILVLTVVNQILQPNIVRLFKDNEMESLQKLVADSSFYMFFLTLVVAFGLAYFSDFILQHTFGLSYAVASLPLQILAVAQIVNVFFGSVGTILNMTGMEKEALISIGIAILLNFVLDLIMIPSLGMIGAAVSSLMSITVWNLISRHFVLRRLGIESSGVIHILMSKYKSKG